MNMKLVLGAAAFVAAAAFSAPSFADDMAKPMDKPMHHRHHHAVHPVAVHPMMHHHHGGMGVDAKERDETAKLNQGQLSHPGM